MRKISIASGGTVEIAVNFAGGILDGDKGGVVVAAVVGGTVLAELRAVDPQPQPAQLVYGAVQACVDIVAQRGFYKVCDINGLPAGVGMDGAPDGRHAVKAAVAVHAGPVVPCDVLVVPGAGGNTA